MKIQHHLYLPPARKQPQLRYRIPEHGEAGTFDSMTGATVWAMRNLQGWDWRIEPFYESPPM